MPIKPENAARYPKNWKELRAAVLERAGHRCEQCGIENYTMRVNNQGAEIKIVLTIAHIEHDELETQDISRLRAWCQRCHLAYDHEHHMRNARDTRHKRKAIGDMFV